MQRPSTPDQIWGSHKVMLVLDSLMIAYGIGFFAVSILYVLACEKM